MIRMMYVKAKSAEDLSSAEKQITKLLKQRSPTAHREAETAKAHRG